MATILPACTESGGGGSTCAQTLSCIQQCVANDVSEDCEANCVALISTAAAPYYTAMENCQEPSCTDPTDAGTIPPCQGNMGAADCTACIQTYCSAQVTACDAH